MFVNPLLLQTLLKKISQMNSDKNDVCLESCGFDHLACGMEEKNIVLQTCLLIVFFRRKLSLSVTEDIAEIQKMTKPRSSLSS
jgi:hypothetical protein